MDWRRILFDIPTYNAPSPLIYREVSSKTILPVLEIIDLLLGSPRYFILPTLCKGFSKEELKALLKHSSQEEVEDFGKKGREFFLTTMKLVCLARNDYGDNEDTVKLVANALTSTDVGEVYRKCLGLADPEINPTTTHGQHPFDIALGCSSLISSAEATQWVSALTNQCLDYFLHHLPTDDINYAPPFQPWEPLVWTQDVPSSVNTPNQSNDNTSLFTPTTTIPRSGGSGTQLQGTVKTCVPTKSKTVAKPSGIPRPTQARKSTSIPSNKARMLGQTASPLAKQTPAIKASNRAANGKRGVGTRKSVGPSMDTSVSIPSSATGHGANGTEGRRRSARFIVG